MKVVYNCLQIKVEAIQYKFEGTDYSVVPNVTSKQEKNGDSWYIPLDCIYCIQQNCSCEKGY